MTPILVNVADAARMCGVSKTTFLEWNRAGLVDLVKIGGRGKLLVRYTELERLATEAVPA